MKTTIKDVARLAGVSFKTVSRVINKEPSVKKETIELVEKAISELNYHPNPAARNLASIQSFAVAYVYDNPNAYYVINMQEGLLKACSEFDYQLQIHPCDASAPDIVEQIIRMALRSNLAGLILSPPLSEMPELLNTLYRANLPFVGIVSEAPPSDIPSKWVCVDDRQAASDIVSHLIEMGHTRIGFLSGDRTHRSTLQREKGYLEAMAEHGLPHCPLLSIEGNYSFQSGIDGATALLTLDDPPTAIFACNDEIASGALLGAWMQGYAVPDDLAVAGFEDSPFAIQAWQPLTTAAQDNREIAYKAGCMLIDGISGRRRSGDETTRKPTTWHYCPKLLIRESTMKEPG